MKIITDIAEVENEVFKASIYNLYILLQQKIPEFFGSQSYNIYVHDDFAEVVWTTKKQVMAEDFTDMLEKKIGAKILYASKEENGRIVKAQAYSLPIENNMYTIYLSSSQYGILDSITVFFFDSLELMYYRLRKDYHGITKVDADIYEKQSLIDLVSLFI